MRHAMDELGADPARVNPLIPAELVIDHSVIADVFGRGDALTRNVDIEYSRNSERYRFLRWGQQSLEDFAVVPPGHRHHAPGQHRVPRPRRHGGRGLGVPRRVPGHRLPHHHGQRARRPGLGHRRHRGRSRHARRVTVDAAARASSGSGCTASCPRAPPPPTWSSPSPRCSAGTVSSGSSSSSTVPGVSAITLADRATISNMSPEFGSTCAFFPIDEETLRYLRFTGRPRDASTWSRPTPRHQGLWHDPDHQPVVLRARRARPGHRGPLSRRPAPPPGPRPARQRPSAPSARPFPRSSALEPADEARRRPGSTKPPTSRSRPATPPRSTPTPCGPDARAPSPRQLARWSACLTARTSPSRSPWTAATTSSTTARRHRRHHLVHQHLQPLGHGRRRPAGQERRRARPAQPALGQDEPVARARRSSPTTSTTPA